MAHVESGGANNLAFRAWSNCVTVMPFAVAMAAFSAGESDGFGNRERVVGGVVGSLASSMAKGFDVSFGAHFSVMASGASHRLANPVRNFLA